MYFALARSYVSWEEIAARAIKMCNSLSKLIVEDKGWGEPIMFDVAAIKRDFILSSIPGRSFRSTSSIIRTSPILT